MSLAGMKQVESRAKRRARDVEELEALAEAQKKYRERIVTEIREEWDAFVNKEAHRDAGGQLIWSERLIRTLGEEGIATLRWLARGGDREAARLLTDRLLGAPDAPFSEKVKQMDEEQALASLREILSGSNLSDMSVEGILRVFANPPAPALREVNP